MRVMLVCMICLFTATAPTRYERCILFRSNPCGSTQKFCASISRHGSYTYTLLGNFFSSKEGYNENIGTILKRVANEKAELVLPLPEYEDVFLDCDVNE